jgi:hypothetical protein
MNQRASHQSEQSFFPYSPSPFPQSSPRDIEDYILELLARLEEVEDERQRASQVTLATTTPKSSSCARVCDKVRSSISKLFCIRRDGRRNAKRAYDSAAAKQSICKGLRHVKKKVREGEMTRIRAAHLEGCLGAMEAIIEGEWDGRSPPESE